MIRHLEQGIALCFLAVRECRELVEEGGLTVPSWIELSVTRPERRRNQSQPTEARVATCEVPALTFGFYCSHPGLSCSSCAADCTCPSPCCTVIADVAASSTCLATIAQGCLGKEGSLSSAPQRKSAGVRAPRTCSCATWIAVFNALDGRRMEIVADGLSSWQGAQLFQEGWNGQGKSYEPRRCRSGCGASKGGSHFPRALWPRTFGGICRRSWREVQRDSSVLHSAGKSTGPGSPVVVARQGRGLGEKVEFHPFGPQHALSACCWWTAGLPAALRGRSLPSMRS